MGNLPPVTLSVVEEDEEDGSHAIYDMFYSAELEDEEGLRALSMGSYCYTTAMSLQSPEEHKLRVQYFQAAQVLYLHAWAHGNMDACCNLGYVYSYDRCEGEYWQDTVLRVAEEAGITLEDRPELAFSREESAFNCYMLSAGAGAPDACYKVGDMLKNGMGCDVDLVSAFDYYERAYELGKAYAPVLWGSAAFRLATCYEEGEGIKQSFEKAHEWYEIAVAGLESAVNAGDWFYKKVLASAKGGLKRTEQELWQS